MKVVMITGASSGIGKETAKKFQREGWQVVATMRNPQNEKELIHLENVDVTECDVTNLQSIQNVVSYVHKKYGKIDALVNNAGFYTVGVVEGASSEEIRRQIDTNLTGLIEVTRTVLPYMRLQKSGCIINVSSIAGRMAMPLQALYHATKWGVEGFSESLQYEVSRLGIRVKIIEPGVIKTDFYGRSKTQLDISDIPEYQPFADTVMDNLMKNGQNGSSPKETADTIFKAATDDSCRLRYSTGTSKNVPVLYRLLPQRVFAKIAESSMMSKRKE